MTKVERLKQIVTTVNRYLKLFLGVPLCAATMVVALMYLGKMTFSTDPLTLLSLMVVICICFIFVLAVIGLWDCVESVEKIVKGQ